MSFCESINPVFLIWPFSALPAMRQFDLTHGGQACLGDALEDQKYS
jgi:hypothetical protein